MSDAKMCMQSHLWKWIQAQSRLLTCMSTDFTGLWTTCNCGQEQRSICKRPGSTPANSTVAPTVPPKGGCPLSWTKFDTKVRYDWGPEGFTVLAQSVTYTNVLLFFSYKQGVLFQQNFLFREEWLPSLKSSLSSALIYCALYSSISYKGTLDGFFAICKIFVKLVK